RGFSRSGVNHSAVARNVAGCCDPVRTAPAASWLGGRHCIGECIMGYRPLLSLPFAACLALSAGEAGAVTRAWPGVAPCAGSLQACIDASGATDVVEITTNATIDETLTINKPMVVRAAAGYAPRLAADRGVSGNVNAAGTWTWRVEG